jgi:hypothetical protein
MHSANGRGMGISRGKFQPHTSKGKSNVRDTEIGCYPRLAMDPFQPTAVIFQFIS